MAVVKDDLKTSRLNTVKFDIRFKTKNSIKKNIQESPPIAVLEKNLHVKFLSRSHTEMSTEQVLYQNRTEDRVFTHISLQDVHSTRRISFHMNGCRLFKNLGNVDSASTLKDEMVLHIVITCEDMLHSVVVKANFIGKKETRVYNVYFIYLISEKKNLLIIVKI